MRVLVPFGDSYNVSTETSLLNHYDISKQDTIVVSLINDGADPVSLFVDPSVSSGAVNTGRRQSALAAAGDECSIEIEGSMYPYISISAGTDSPYPTAAVRFEIRQVHPRGVVQK